MAHQRWQPADRRKNRGPAQAQGFARYRIGWSATKAPALFLARKAGGKPGGAATGQQRRHWPAAAFVSKSLSARPLYRDSVLSHSTLRLFLYHPVDTLLTALLSPPCFYSLPFICILQILQSSPRLRSSASHSSCCRRLARSALRPYSRIFTLSHFIRPVPACHSLTYTFSLVRAFICLDSSSWTESHTTLHTQPAHNS